MRAASEGDEGAVTVMMPSVRTTIGAGLRIVRRTVKVVLMTVSGVGLLLLIGYLFWPLMPVAAGIALAAILLSPKVKLHALYELGLALFPLTLPLVTFAVAFLVDAPLPIRLALAVVLGLLILTVLQPSASALDR